MSDPYADAEDELCRALNDGAITEAEFRAEMRAMGDEIREYAQDAYEREMERW